MPKHAHLVAVAAILYGASASAAGQTTQARVEFAGGTVTIVAEDTAATDLLQLWAVAGKTEVKRPDPLSQRRVSLNLVGVPEDEALEAVLGQAYAFMGRLKQGAVEGTSRFSQITVTPRGPHQRDPGNSPALPPEARFAYTPPGHTLSTPDVQLTGALPVSRVTGGAGDPETWMEYSGPQAAKLRDPRGEMTGAVGTFRPNLPSQTREPETLFEYSIPRRAQEALARPDVVRSQPTKAAPPGPLDPPSSRAVADADGAAVSHEELAPLTPSSAAVPLTTAIESSPRAKPPAAPTIKRRANAHGAGHARPGTAKTGKKRAAKRI
jgi:hypothetical protein